MSKPEAYFVVDAEYISLILAPEETLVDEVQEDFEKGLLGQDLDGHKLGLV
jgi:hypothetical protein